MIAAAVTSLLMGEEVDPQRLYRAMTRHDVKNRANAYFLPKSEQEQEAREAGDIALAVAAFREVQKGFHESSNDDKNGALYVNPGQPFLSPLERYTEDDFVRVRTRNEEFLTLSYPKVQMLKGWSKDWGTTAAVIQEIRDVMGLDALDMRKPENLLNLESSLMERLQAFLQSKDDPRSPA